jgi:hypothetical protein
MFQGTMFHIVGQGAALLALTAFANPAASRTAAIAGSVAAAPGHYSAPVVGCDKCEDGPNQHAFTGSGAFFDCQAFNACHSNWQSGWCGDYHCTCGGCETDDEAAGQLRGQVLTAESVRSVAALSDRHAVERLLTDYPVRVHYNAARHVIQLTACDGSVTAQYPVSASLAEALDQ